MIRYVLFTFAVLTAPAFAGNCGHFFAHKQAVVVQQVVAAPIVYYSVGESLLIEAAVEKAFQRREQQSAQHAPPSQTGTLAATGSVLTAKCLRCHNGTRDDTDFDLRQPMTDFYSTRTTEILSDINVPDKMKGVISGLQKGDHANLLQETLTRWRNERQQPAKQEPPVAPPDPFQGQSGELR